MTLFLSFVILFFFSNIILLECKMYHNFKSSYFIWISLVVNCIGERLNEQIYSPIEGAAPCFRRLNGTHQAGCTSSEKGAVGIVHMIYTVSDAQWMIHNSSAGPYVGVVDSFIFNDIINDLLEFPENVAGIVLYENITVQPNFFSLESRCPNEYSSALGSQCSSSTAGGIVWNEHGKGLLRSDIPFPIFYLPHSKIDEVEKIKSCYQRFNLDKNNQMEQSLCSLQLNSFMFAAVDTEVCLRRSTSSYLNVLKVCDPLTNQNVQYSLFPLRQGEVVDNRTITFVTARIDSTSLFDGLSPGGASSLVGMVTLITAAVTLSKMIPITDSIKYKRNILWTLLSGESFDYIGSQRIAYDLAHSGWPPSAPLNLSQFALHIELGQLGGLLGNSVNTTEWPIKAFIPHDETSSIEVQNFLKYVNSSSIEQKVTANLPPSSLHSFRRIIKEKVNSIMPEVLLVDHDETFTNMFYQSVLDDARNIGFKYHNISINNNGTFLDTDSLIANGTMKNTESQVKIAYLATRLAHSLYQTVTGNEYVGQIAASAHLVDELLYCFMSSLTCRALLAADYVHNTEETVVPKPVPLYVGVAQWNGPAPVFAGHLLALLTGTEMKYNHTTCESMKDSSYSYYWLRGWNYTGVCIQTTMNFSQALSPAFTIPDYDFKSGVYSTWTESVWRSMWARIFVTASGAGARTAAIIGAFCTVFAAFLTYWLQKHAEIIFVTSGNNVLTVNSDATTGILRTVNC